MFREREKKTGKERERENKHTTAPSDFILFSPFRSIRFEEKFIQTDRFFLIQTQWSQRVSILRLIIFHEKIFFLRFFFFV